MVIKTSSDVRMLASGTGPNPVGSVVHPNRFYLTRQSAHQLHVTPFNERLERCVKTQKHRDAWPPTEGPLLSATSVSTIIRKGMFSHRSISKAHEERARNPFLPNTRTSSLPRAPTEQWSYTVDGRAAK